MKRWIASSKEWIVVCLVLVGILGATAMRLQTHLDANHRLVAKRLAHAVIPLLNEAHRQHDDLTMQQVVGALAQAPGVAIAAVTDADDKAMVHNRLSQIGKPLELPRRGDPAHTFLLRQNTDRWGQLVFTLSDAAERQAWMETVLSWSIAVFVLALAYGLRLGIEARRLSAARRNAEDANALLADQRQQTERLTHALVDHQLQARTLLQAVLGKLPEPVLLLDQQQRVAAFNLLAAQQLKLDPRDTTLPSWLDVPWLQDQGAALERSLAHPDTDVTIDANGEPAGRLRTEAGWTWVMPRPLLRVCR